MIIINDKRVRRTPDADRSLKIAIRELRTVYDRIRTLEELVGPEWMKDDIGSCCIDVSEAIGKLGSCERYLQSLATSRANKHRH